MNVSFLFRGSSFAAIVAAAVFGGMLRQADARDTKAKVNMRDAKPVAKVDLNKATMTELEALPGVGASTAKKIIAGRPYKSVDDLSKAGVSASAIKKMIGLVTVNAATDAAPLKDSKPLKEEAKTRLVDLNTATTKQLEELPGVEAANAKKIIANRPYKSVDDLSKTGIPAATIGKFKALVTVGSTKTTYRVAKPVDTESTSKLVDLNSAKVAALEEVPGIGEVYAKKIIDGRPYKSIDDLSKAGIPAATIAKIRALVTVGREAQTPPHKGMVWVNLDTKRYHKETSRWYGKTKNGKFMTEAEAVKEGFKSSKQ